jgi:type II secretory pathway pseudopilin PulG
MKRNHPMTSAFTLLEVLVVVCLIVVLFLNIVPTFKRADQKGIRVRCAGNLKNIGVAHQVFAADHSDKFPSQTNSIVAYARALTNEYIWPRIYYCPGDKQRAPVETWQNFSTKNISYFFNVAASATYPGSIMAGDSDLLVNGVPLASGRNVVPVAATVSWSTDRHMKSSYVSMGDGSVQALSVPRLQETLTNSGTNEMVLLAP